MTARIWSDNGDITLTCYRIMHFNFLLTAAILVLICVCHASGLFSLQTFIKFFIYASLLYFSLNWIFLYNCNCFQLGKPSWNFNTGWTSLCNQALKKKKKAGFAWNPQLVRHSLQWVFFKFSPLFVVLTF